MIKVVLNLSDDANILKSLVSYFKGTASGGLLHAVENDIDKLISKTNNVETVFTSNFSKCVCDDKNGWTIAVCVLNGNSANLDKIKKLYMNLSGICSDKVYLLAVFGDRYVAANLAWENDIDNIDIQVLPKNGDWSILFQNISKYIAQKDKIITLRNKDVILYGYKPYAASSYVDINYICDAGYHGEVNINKKSVPVISLNSMLKKKKAYVLIGLIDQDHLKQAVDLLKSKGIEYDFLDNYIIKPVMIYLDYIVNHSIVCYRDIWKNKFVYAGNRPYRMAINIQPFSYDRRMDGNKVYIGNNFECSLPQNSYIRLRSPKNYVYIADNVTIISAEIIVSGAQKVIIRENTLIARNAILRCEISHTLFDGKTKAALPQKQDIYIGRHVWLGEECYLLSGARVGDGAVMGARSVTSGSIEANTVAVGAPAKVIKTNILWSKDNFDLDQKKTIYDCVDQDGLKYYDGADKK